MGGVVLGLVLGGGLVAAASVPLPTGPPGLSLTIPAAPASAALPSLPFPSQGESAVTIPTLGVFMVHGPQTPVPIASLTKLMTAYVALKVLPLGLNDTGPSLTVTAADVAEYNHDIKTGQSCVVVAAGEVLTERQLLDGMLVHSASNFASMLSRMVAGDTSTMVSEMNANASQLGLTATSYADVSGLNPSSESSATDVLHLASLLMRNPTFAAIVRQTSVELPVAGTVTTYTPYLGKPGVVGVKTGTTSESGGCMVMAFDAIVGGRVVQVLDAVLGQRSVHYSLLEAAGHAALVLASGTVHHITAWRVALAGAPVGALGWPTRSVPVMATNTVIVPTFPGVPAQDQVLDQHWGRSAVPAGTAVATLFVRTGSYSIVSELLTAAALTRPTLLDRLR